MIYEVCHFNEVVVGIPARDIGPMPEAEYQHLCKAIVEELQEFQDGYAQEDVVAMTDALIDLIYFTIGGIYKMGIPPEKIHECFHAIHQANMLKKSGTVAKRATGAADAVKPAGWVSPEQSIGKILFDSGVE